MPGGVASPSRSDCIVRGDSGARILMSSDWIVRSDCALLLLRLPLLGVLLGRAPPTPSSGAPSTDPAVQYARCRPAAAARIPPPSSVPVGSTWRGARR